MNWDDFRYFLAVCREGTVTGAGRVLEVNYTTVARRITTFEQNLGVRLFARTRDGYVMTQSAEDMYAQAEMVEANVLAIDRKMYGRDSALKGPLKVTAHQQFADIILVPELPRFHKEHPRIELELLTNTGVLDLTARQADLAIRFTRKPADDLVGRRLMDVAIGLYASSAYLSKREKPTRLIIHRRYKEMPWTRTHFPNAKIVLRVDSTGTLTTAVRNGIGIGVMSCFQGDSYPELRRLDLSLPRLDVGIWVLNHVDLRTTARVRAAREFLVAVIDERREFIAGERSRYAKLP